jgi:hypothetical protein
MDHWTRTRDGRNRNPGPCQLSHWLSGAYAGSVHFRQSWQLLLSYYR